MKRIMEKDYIPTTEDILYCRTKTVGANSIMITRKFAYELVDTGGQKSERRKWKSNIAETNLIIYIISLSDYDETIFEDDTTNSMIESIVVFEDYINRDFLRDIPVCILFNKKKILEKKLKHTPLSKVFPEYEGGDDIEKAVDFIKDKFLSKVKYTNVCFSGVYDIMNRMEAETFFVDVDNIAVELLKEGKLKEILV